MSRALLLASSLCLAACGSAPPPAPAPCPCEAQPPPAAEAGCTEGYPYAAHAEGSVLPTTPGSDAPPETPGVLSVWITADGAIRIAERPVDLEGLRRVAQERHDKDPDVRAVIQADRAAPWASVVAAIDGLKRGGIAKLAFAVAAEKG